MATDFHLQPSRASQHEVSVWLSRETVAGKDVFVLGVGGG